MFTFFLAQAGGFLDILVAGFTLGFFTINTGRKKKASQDDFNPQSAEEFNITSAREGTVLPWTGGEVKQAGNIMWNDHIFTNEIRENVSSGGGSSKGGGDSGSSSQVQVTGFRYFISLWVSLVHGKIEVIRTFVNEVEREPTFTAVAFNDGTEDTTPFDYEGLSAPPFSERLPGVAWYFYQWFFIGNNTTVLPTVHYVTKRILETPVDDQNMYEAGDISKGNNPAALVYQIFIDAGAAATDFDLASFQTAAAFWKGKGYGLSPNFTSVAKVQDNAEKILSYVEGATGFDGEGRIRIKAFDPLDAVVDSLSDATGDFVKIEASKNSYKKIPNDFKASFKDRDQDYSVRTVIVQNDSAIFHAGQRNTRTIDLGAFNTKEAASKRLFEIMKTLSFPTVEMKFETTMRFSHILVGDLVSITDSELGIITMTVRITKKSMQNIDKNLVKFEGVELIEAKFDSNFLDVGAGPSPVPDSTLSAFSHIKIVELPFTNLFGFNPAYAVLVSREIGIETAFNVLISPEIAGDFQVWGTFTTFAQHGILDAIFPVTPPIDDLTGVGIDYTATALDPVFTSISFLEWLSTARLAFLGDEIIAFQFVTATGDLSRKLENNIRGVLQTDNVSHPLGSEIFIADLGLNIINNPPYNVFYVKIVPFFPSETFDESLITPILVTNTERAKLPRDPGALEAIRVVDDVTLNIHPNSPDVQGFGDGPIATAQTSKGYPYTGTLLVDDGTTVTELTTPTSSIDISKVGAYTVTVKSKRFGRESSGLSLLIPASDGTFYAAS